MATRSRAQRQTIALSEVETEEVKWIWIGRIARGKTTIVDGDPDMGKSTLTTDLVARWSIGRPMPGEQSPSPPGCAIVINYEDGLADTTKPRLIAAEGDPARVFDLSEVYDEKGDIEQPFDLGRDLDVLEREIQSRAADLVVIDPLMAALPANVNSHRDQDVRGVLARLKSLAQRTGAAFVLVRHLNKAPFGGAMYRGGGSIGIIGAARFGLIAGRDPSDPDARILAVTKANLAPQHLRRSLRYRLVSAPDDPHRAIVEWLGESDLSADDLVSPASGSTATNGASPAVNEAKEFLQTELADGPRKKAELVELATRQRVAPRTLERASKQLGVMRKGDKGALWQLPVSPGPAMPIGEGESGETDEPGPTPPDSPVPPSRQSQEHGESEPGGGSHGSSR